MQLNQLNEMADASALARSAPAALQAEADRLRSIASQMEVFLARQVDRMEQEFAAASVVTTANTTVTGAPVEIQGGWEELERAAAKWEEERAAEMARLYEDSQRLLEGWAKLEREQRELLKQRLPGKVMAGGTPTAIPISPAPVSGASPSPMAPMSSAKSESNEATNARNQFQQLRREMLDHARQRRKG